jgi:hypothetical protein
MSNEHYKNMQSVCEQVRIVRYQQLRTQARLQMKGSGKYNDPDPVASFGYEPFMDLQQFM